MLSFNKQLQKFKLKAALLLFFKWNVKISLLKIMQTSRPGEGVDCKTCRLFMLQTKELHILKAKRELVNKTEH